jgi:hypothetical protein
VNARNAPGSHDSWLDGQHRLLAIIESEPSWWRVLLWETAWWLPFLPRPLRRRLFGMIGEGRPR